MMYEHGKNVEPVPSYQKGDRTMTKKQKTPRKRPEATALVRAADGTLYLISKTKETITLKPEQKEKV